MTEECVVAVYENGIRAQQAIEKLIASGFPKSNVSLVARSAKGAEADVKRTLQFGDDMEKDGILGAGIGAIVGLLGGGTAMSAFGATVLVIAGPIVAVTGAVVGGLIGAIAGWGVHHDRAAEYQKKVEAGKVLLIAHHADPQKIAQAEKVLQTTKPDELHLHAKTDDGDDPSVDD
jgi:hypothetical protein